MNKFRCQKRLWLHWGACQFLVSLMHKLPATGPRSWPTVPFKSPGLYCHHPTFSVQNLAPSSKLAPLHPLAVQAFRNGGTIEELRAKIDLVLANFVDAMKKRYAVKIEEQTIAGVHTRIFTAVDAMDAERVLIDLHGGGFQSCWESCSVLESVPIAAVGHWKVISKRSAGPRARLPGRQR